MTVKALRSFKHTTVLSVPENSVFFQEDQAQGETGTIKQTKWTFFREKQILYQLWY